MARRPRCDEAGSWHHVINRGIARRPLFETRADQRFFLSRLARQVRAGRLELHAYCILTTHYHLLLRSPLGDLAEGMRQSQNDYSRYFNRRLKRDGSLVRGRFFSRRVDSSRYFHVVVRYIDANAAEAGLGRWAGDYEMGSARAYLGGRRPPWLSTAVVEEAVKRAAARSVYRPTDYLRVFGSKTDQERADLQAIVDARMSSSAIEDPLEDLVGQAPDAVREWMLRKARLADGPQTRLATCSRRSIVRALDRHIAAFGGWEAEPGRGARCGDRLARIGLLRDLGGHAFSEIARLENATPAQIRTLYLTHCRALIRDVQHRDRSTRIACHALNSMYGAAHPSQGFPAALRAAGKP